jgi:DNA-3-methyladenine glycosylase II
MPADARMPVLDRRPSYRDGQASRRRQGVLTPVPPFDLAKSLAFLEGFGPTRGEQDVAGGELTKAFECRGRAVLVRLRQEGAPDTPGLCYELLSDEPIDADVERAAVDRVRFFLSTDDDLSAFETKAQKDPAFAPLARRMRGLRHVKFPSPFEAACWGVINQRIGVSVARRMKDGLVQALGPRALAGGAARRAFPAADRVARAGETELGEILGNARKARAVAAVARAFAGVDERFLREAQIDVVRSWLLAIHGVGVWTSGFVLYRGLGRFDAASGLAPKLVEAAREVYGKESSKEDLLRICAGYGAWGGQWMLSLWAASFVP